MRSEPRQDKIKRVEQLAKEISSYPTIGVLSLHGMPASALQKIRLSVPGTKIKVEKKSIILRALKSVGKERLSEFLCEQPALIMSNIEPFKLFKQIKKKKSKVSAKPGQTAPEDIIIPAGPTDIPAGPAISTLQRVKIATKVEGGKIAIAKDCVVAKKGDKISQDLASALSMLKIKPIEIGLNILALAENSSVYKKDILDIDEGQIISKLKKAAQNALSLTLGICYPTPDNIAILLLKGYTEAKMLGLQAGLLVAGIIEDLLAKAQAQAAMLASQIKEG